MSLRKSTEKNQTYSYHLPMKFHQEEVDFQHYSLVLRIEKQSDVDMNELLPFGLGTVENAASSVA